MRGRGRLGSTLGSFCDQFIYLRILSYPRAFEVELGLCLHGPQVVPGETILFLLMFLNLPNSPKLVVSRHPHARPLRLPIERIKLKYSQLPKLVLPGYAMPIAIGMASAMAHPRPSSLKQFIYSGRRSGDLVRHHLDVGFCGSQPEATRL